MSVFALALLGAAFMPPLLRTVMFVSMGTALFLTYSYIVNINFCFQVAFYLFGAVSFIRCGAHVCTSLRYFQM